MWENGYNAVNPGLPTHASFPTLTFFIVTEGSFLFCEAGKRCSIYADESGQAIIGGWEKAVIRPSSQGVILISLTAAGTDGF